MPSKLAIKVEEPNTQIVHRASTEHLTLLVVGVTPPIITKSQWNSLPESLLIWKQEQSPNLKGILQVKENS